MIRWLSYLALPQIEVEVTPGIHAQGRGGCRPLLCRNYCVNGRVQSGDCDTCTCTSTAGSAVSSGLAGRQVSSCQQRSLCRNFCFQGRATDSNGCQTCNCRSSGGSAVSSGLAGRQVSSCQQRSLCRNFCFQGRATDSNGCQTCSCRSSSGATPNGRSISGSSGVQVRRPILIRCKPVRCRSVCPGGRVRVDRTGCPTCQCESRYRFRG